MTNSADVAAEAGVSRSTVSQILNGHGHRFTPDMVQRVQQAADSLGYRPSLAGRSLKRGTSDVVLTLIPDITFGPRLRELVDDVTRDLADAGVTNLLRFASSSTPFEDAVLALRPRGVWNLASFTPEQRDRLTEQGANLVEQSPQAQAAIDREIGAFQAQRLAEAGYDVVGPAVPTDFREMPFADARAEGALKWCAENGLATAPTLHVDLRRGGPTAAAELLRASRLGIAAYNDDVALAVLGAAAIAGRRVPDDLGVIGVDDTTVAAIATPSIATVSFAFEFSENEIVRALLLGGAADAEESFEDIRMQLRFIPGGSIASPQR